MKKIIFCIIMIISIYCSVSVALPKCYINAVHHTDVFNEFRSGTGYDAGILFELQPNSYLDIGMSSFQGDFLPTREAKPKYLSKGTFDLSSVNVGYRGEYKTGSGTAYHALGMSCYKFTNKLDRSVTEYYQSIGDKYEEWIDGYSGFYGGMGFLWDFSGVMRIDVGIKYIDLHPQAHKKTTVLASDTAQEDDQIINLSHLTFNIGLQF